MGLLDDDNAPPKALPATVSLGLGWPLPRELAGLLDTRTPEERAAAQVLEIAEFYRSIGREEVATQLENALTTPRKGAPSEWTESEREMLFGQIISIMQKNDRLSLSGICSILVKREPWASRLVRGKPVTDTALKRQYEIKCRTLKVTAKTD
jgi:hypothetical protein